MYYHPQKFSIQNLFYHHPIGIRHHLLSDRKREGKKKVEHIGTVTITDSCSYGGENIALAMIPNAAAEIEEFTFDDGSVASVESI